MTNIVMTMILTKLITIPRWLRGSVVATAENWPILGPSRNGVNETRPVASCGVKPCRSLEPERQFSTKHSRIADVCAAENRLEVVKENLICKVLNIKLNIQCHAFLLPQIGAY